MRPSSLDKRQSRGCPTSMTEVTELRDVGGGWKKIFRRIQKPTHREATVISNATIPVEVNPSKRTRECYRLVMSQPYFDALNSTLRKDGESPTTASQRAYAAIIAWTTCESLLNVPEKHIRVLIEGMTSQKQWGLHGVLHRLSSLHVTTTIKRERGRIQYSWNLRPQFLGFYEENLRVRHLKIPWKNEENTV